MKIDEVVRLLYGPELLATGIVVGVHEREDGHSPPALDVLSPRTVVGGPTMPHVFKDLPHVVAEGASVIRWGTLEEFPDAPEGGTWDPLLGGVSGGQQIATDTSGDAGAGAQGSTQGNG